MTSGELYRNHMIIPYQDDQQYPGAWRYTIRSAHPNGLNKNSFPFLNKQRAIAHARLDIDNWALYVEGWKMPDKSQITVTKNDENRWLATYETIVQSGVNPIEALTQLLTHLSREVHER